MVYRICHKIIKKIAIIGLFLYAQPMMAAQISGDFEAVKRVKSPTFFNFLGFSDRIIGNVEDLFSPGSLLASIFQLNYLLSFIVLFSVIFLGYYPIRIISYSNPDGENATHLGLIFAVMQHKAIDFFQKYCVRAADGTYVCSFSRHQHYFRLARLSFVSSAVTGGFKVILIFTLFILQNNISNAAGRSSANYDIFADSSLGGGGQISSTNYSLQGSLSEAVASPVISSSNNYRNDSGLQAITDEPSISLSVGGPSVTFGPLNSNTTAYGSHTLTAYYNGSNGYDIVVTGSSLSNENSYSLTSIGSSNAASISGTEQFGINLKANTSPNIGSNASGGHGQAYGQYGTANRFAFNSGDTIARSTVPSTITTYTVSMIANVARTTPSGTYLTDIYYSIVPRY